MINTDSTQAKNLDDAQEQQIGGYIKNNYVGASGQFNLPAGNQLVTSATMAQPNATAVVSATSFLRLGRRS